MKGIILSVALLAIVSIGSAQTEKGDWMVGGSLRLNTSKNNTEFNISPSGAAFIIHNLAVGGNVSFDYSKIGTAKSTQFGIGPLVRYYFTDADVRPILQGTISFLTNTTRIPSVGSTSNSGVNYFLGGGAAIFISDQVSIDGLIGYDHTKINSLEGSGGFALNVGFQVYLHKRQIEKVRGR